MFLLVMTFIIEGMKIKERFPIFSNRPDLVYMDNAATTQRLDRVADVIDEFNRKDNATIHRGVYDLSANATIKYEEVRQKVASFLGSDSNETIAFTKGTTESINIVAQSFLKKRLTKGDNVVVTVMEHHANFIPWQVLCREMECEFRVVPLTDQYEVDVSAYRQLIDAKTKMVAVTHISNVLGTVNPIKELIEIAHHNNTPVLVDAAQSAALYDLNAKKLRYDFLAFSGHKVFGPFGVGVLYVNPDYINDMRPYSLGGGIVRSVSIDEVTFQTYPHNLDAGTPNVSGVLGLGAALDFLTTLDRGKSRSDIADLTNACIKRLMNIGVKVYAARDQNRSGIVSFSVDDIHPHDIATFLNADGIALRAGLHCAQPLHHNLGLPSSVRASFSIYNTDNEADMLVSSIKSLIAFWK